MCCLRERKKNCFSKSKEIFSTGTIVGRANM